MNRIDLEKPNKKMEQDLIKRKADLQCTQEKLQDQGCVRDYELQVRHKSGDIRTLLVSMEPITYGLEPTLIWVFVDLTDVG